MRRLALILVLALVAALGPVRVPTALAAEAASGLAATRAGILRQTANALVRTLAEDGIRLRVEPFVTTQQYIPVVDAGRVPFAISNAMEYEMAVAGSGLSAGRPAHNLRLVARLMTWRIGFVAPLAGDIRTAAGLAGRRVPAGFDNAPLYRWLVAAMLAAGAVPESAVVPVAVGSLQAQWLAFREGRIDVAVVQPGSAVARELADALPDGLRFLAMPTDARAVVPGIALERAAGAEPVFMSYPILLWAHRAVPDETVHALVRALHRAEARLRASGGPWSGFRAAAIADHAGPAVHPGAARYFREAGLGPR
ncbi:MAG: hypothetical protein FJX67_04300 [Alphaproteobacteria bacterium]|nr:hypothetical protein [Alphaproteobacteria bacterium]